MRHNILHGVDLREKGELQVRVFADSISQPIENARVRIMDKNSNYIIDEVKTDLSGKTPNIELIAPPIDYSMNYSSQKPYSEYNLMIEADDFDGVFIHGVQLFSGSQALQNVTLNYKKR